MIMRVFQVTTKAGKEKDFGEFFHQTAIPLMKETEGIVQVLPGSPRADSPREFSFVMIWNVDPAEAELVESRSIKHYDLVE